MGSRVRGQYKWVSILPALTSTTQIHIQRRREREGEPPDRRTRCPDRGGGFVQKKNKWKKKIQLAFPCFKHHHHGEEATQIMQEDLLNTKQKIAMMKSYHEARGTSGSQVPISLGTQHSLKEPIKVKSKGCGTRLRGGKDKALCKKSRKCHGCGLTGHSKRNCPKLVNMKMKMLSCLLPYANLLEYGMKIV